MDRLMPGCQRPTLLVVLPIEERWDPGPARSEHMSRRLRRCILLAAASFALGCDDAASTGLPAGAADGLYPHLTVAGASAELVEVRLSLLRRPEEVRLGSFQGELTFDATALAVMGASFPAGTEGVA